ncbi:MAG TPA: peptidoglycan DD-metalloendopeptidase family protein [Hyphomicrobiales bacterium]|nr:peptidoglycan DD-metalloendopeptidase family protein [Rhodobiaceae bacterium]HXK53868.1 peptidoglycan DD-metalloendopeptidase family protein [Hyphomicrobiales bacterium]
MTSVLALAAGCSSSITRLQQPFFPEAEKNEVTGSLAPVPKVDLGSARVWTDNAAPLVSTSAPTAPIERQAVPRTSQDGFSVVQAGTGDTAYTMSRRYGVSVRRIMAANDLARAEDMRPGQDVRIPPVDWEPSKAAKAPAAAARTVSADRVHVVNSGDTLSQIARRNNMTAAQLARHNDMDASDRLKIGQRINIPASSDTRVASLGNQDARDLSRGAPEPTLRPSPAQSSASRQNSAPAVAARETERPSEPAERKVASLQAEPEPAPRRAGPLPAPDAMSSSQFRWPVRGRVISTFGSKPNGAQNDGINIAVPEGTSVKAAENGVVAYVGNELKGYGNLVLVRHADDWVTAYAHNSQTLVQRGDKVTRGQIIAKAGQTGAVTSPQLHFELRKGSRPLDPLPKMAEN